MTQRPHVGEIDLGGLDEPFAHVREVRAEHEHLPGRFQHGQPRLDGVDRDPEIPRYVAQVQKLTASGRQNHEEALEFGEISHLPEGAHVAFEVGLDIASVPQGGIAFGVREGFRVSASQERLPEPRVGKTPGRAGRRRPGGRCTLRLPRQGEIRAALRLPPGQWEQMEHGGATGQRLTDILREREILRTGQQVLPHRVPIAVYPLLDVEEEIGGVLRFVVDDRGSKGLEEGARIFPRRHPNVRRLQRDVAMARAEETQQQRRLAGLARTGEHHRRKLARRSLQQRLQRALDVTLVAHGHPF